MVNLAWLTLLMAGVVGLAVWVDRGRTRARARREAIRLSDRTPELPEAAQAFLSRMAGELQLPPEVRAEIRAELSDHLADSIAAIEAEGLDRDRATTEALARLGRPEELARQLRRAHRTTRRLLVGAAGGVFQAGVGAIQGYLFAAVILVFVVILADTALKPLLDFLAAHLPSTHVDRLLTSSAFGAGLACVAALGAGHRSVLAMVRSSRRTAAQIGRWWALGGFLVLGWLVMVVVTAQQNWLVVALELLVPVAFAAGALLRTERRLPLVGSRVPTALTIALAVLLPAAIFAGGTMVVSGVHSSSGVVPSGEDEIAAFDRVAPAWPQGAIVSSGGGLVNDPIIDRTWVVLDAAALSSFSDLRFEAWRGVPLQGTPGWLDDFIPDPGYSNAYAIVPAVVADGQMTVRFDMSHVRTTGWVVFLTGVGPHGVRYSLGRPESLPTQFSGTVWDWLTASE